MEMKSSPSSENLGQETINSKFALYETCFAARNWYNFSINYFSDQVYSLYIETQVLITSTELVSTVNHLIRIIQKFMCPLVSKQTDIPTILVSIIIGQFRQSIAYYN